MNINILYTYRNNNDWYNYAENVYIPGTMSEYLLTCC